MKRFVVLLSVLLPLLLNAQRLHLNLFGGFSSYLGDLQEKSVTLDQTSHAFGLGASYDLTRHLSLRSGFSVGRIGADDKNNRAADLKQRNLSFRSSITEFNVVAQYDFLDLRYHKFTPYVFGGLALYHFNPYTYDSLGSKIYLRPLSTEGQGLAAYPDRKNYKLTQLAIPFGGGIKMRLTDNITIAYELGMRKLFTDHLDDVSSNYVDAATLLAAKGSTAVAMAYRGGELKNSLSAYQVAGTIRGNPRLKDWYYMHGLTLGIGINTGLNRRSKMDCPADVR